MWVVAPALLLGVKWGLGGYTQVRFEAVEGEKGEFLIRRNRLELRMESEGGVMAEVEAEVGGGGKVELKDAYVKWEAGLGLWVKAGQFKWHGSYECLRSSSMLDLLERAEVVESFFPGLRDRGVMVGGRLGEGLFWEVGLWNGNGIKAASEAKISGDSNEEKDFSLRLGNFPETKYQGPSPRLFWQAAIHLGKARDADTKRDLPRRRLSLSAQYYFEPVPDGVYKYSEGSSLKVEFLWGRGYGSDGVPGKRWNDKKAYGFYLTLTKNLARRGKPCRNALALRADFWKPEGWTWALGWHHYLDPRTMLSLVYQAPEGGSSLLRGQCQFKF